MKLSLVSFLAVALALTAVACGNTGDDEGAAGTSSGGDATNEAGRAGNAAAGTGGSAGAGGNAAGAAQGGAAGTGGAPAVPVLVHQLAAALTGGCAIDLKGELRCWGSSNINKTPWAPPPPGPFKSLAAGEGSVCALNGAGELSCFPEPDSPSSPNPLPQGPFVDVAIWSVPCGLDPQGAVRCQEAVGIAAPPSEVFSAISMGRRFGCGIRKSDGSIACWGSKVLDCSDTLSLDLGLTTPPSGSFVAIASSESNSCAVRTDGTLACWGAGSPENDDTSVICGSARLHYGQSKPPTGKFKQVSVGPEHACAIRSDDSVACWGAGKTDQKCEGGNADLCGQSLPPPGQFAEVSVSWFYSCAMDGARKLTCWGANGRGQSTPPVDFP